MLSPKLEEFVRRMSNNRTAYCVDSEGKIRSRIRRSNSRRMCCPLEEEAYQHTARVYHYDQAGSILGFAKKEIFTILYAADNGANSPLEHELRDRMLEAIGQAS